MGIFSSEGHVAGIVTLVVAAPLVTFLSRVLRGPWVTGFCRLLGAALLVNVIANQFVLAAEGSWSAAASAPLNLCDVAQFVVGTALIVPAPILVEVSWFWAIAGVLQADITPSVAVSFPSYGWMVFYGQHIGAVVGALVLVVGRGIHPRKGAVLRVFAITAVYMVGVGVANRFTDGNYNFLRAPARGSLLTLLGPWPWYLVAAAGIALVFFLLLDLPFRLERLHDTPHGGAAATAYRATPQPSTRG